MLDRLLSTIAPHICSSCDDAHGLLCDRCFSDIIDNGYDQCIVCERPSAQSNLSSACHSSVVYDDAWVVGERLEGLRELIDRYKFDRAREGAHVLARLLHARLPVLPAETLVTYIPTITSHVRQRGYDHMALVAQELAALRKLTCRPLLERQTSLPQRGATKRERAHRQVGAFRVSSSVASPVLLIDDVYTTGATMTAGASAVREVSPHLLFVVVVARQPFDR